VNEPWYDYLALPVAPLVLLVQAGALFFRKALWRWGISVGCVAAITGMFFYVNSIPVGPDEGVNIGAGIMLLWLLGTFGLLGILIVRDGLVFIVREFRAERRQRRGSRG
jgi:hypothetical protein